MLMLIIILETSSHYANNFTLLGWVLLEFMVFNKYQTALDVKQRFDFRKVTLGFDENI